nr:PREDICTED: uncharacterized protein LOC100142237 isoform X1 [Tribolium castaneum]|eukprot:XP_008197503.1 PREDICTED: uncharacterized protein LOC100142237 isoform X1 [Tribolium castaneum]
MDQNRPDVNGNHQQNVHLHMHHVCACQSLFPTTYYPPISYRTPLIPYAAAPQTVARPYLQHYQYTQFNVGSQYNMPMTQLSSTFTGSTPGHPGPDSAVAIPSRDRREKGDSQDSVPDPERTPPEPPEFEFGAGPIIPPVNELFFMNNSEDFQMNTDSFIKFLERSCLTAEQIAYRNRNRPCFRNIQNLCIRTRSEILKPRTTISNIHSQGIPWATKDFIYAFVRLTNCWHILKGYWENREGSALGKIEKELTPGFKACYVRWERETVELATELTRIFYNLDVNQSNPSPTVNVHTANNLIPPQVSLLKTGETKKTTASSESATTPTLTNTTSNSSKNVRGILHLPSTLSTETVDQGNQTCSGDFCTKSDDNDSDEENAVVYMKPGSYRVPKKYKNKELSIINKNNSPRVIEFLETAQNITKGLEAANDKYWVKVKTSAKKPEQVKSEIDEPMESEMNSEVFFNVHEWLSNSNFSDYGDRSSSSTSPPKPAQFFPDLLDDTSSNLESDTIPSRTYRRKPETLSIMVYEMKSGGLTKKAKTILEKILYELKGTELAGLLTECVMDGPNLDMVQKNLIRDCYRYVNEFVRDLRHLVNSASQHFKKCDHTEDKLKMFSKKLETLLAEYFPNYDFGSINGHRGEKVGKLKLKNCLFDGDGDHLKN